MLLALLIVLGKNCVRLFMKKKIVLNKKETIRRDIKKKDKR